MPARIRTSGKHPLRLPLGPLVRAYAEAATGTDPTALPGLGPRFRAVLAARDELVSDHFLATASEHDFRQSLLRFYDAVARPALHVAAVEPQAGMVRFALSHLLRCLDPLATKVGRVLADDGEYRVPGLGPAFWSAVCQALDPARNPSWLPPVLAGLERLGLIQPAAVAPAAVYAQLLDAYTHIREIGGEWSAQRIDHFLICVSRMQGRDLDVSADESIEDRVQDALRELRCRTPLRMLLKDRGPAMDAARKELEVGLHDGDAGRMLTALRIADPALAGRPPGRPDFDDALALWGGRLWEADDPFEWLGPFCEDRPLSPFGLGLAAAVLHLRSPAGFPPWNDATRRGLAALDDVAEPRSPTDQYRQYVEAAARFREQFHIHPLELAPLLEAMTDRHEPDEPAGLWRFDGFSTDSFRFLADLATNNRRDWMERERDRYQFVVRGPMVELCHALAARYVRPVLHGTHGWELVTEPRTTHCLSSICKNSYGRAAPYETAIWFAFYRPDQGSKRHDAQLFVRLETTGLTFGLYIGRNARTAGPNFRRNVDEHATALFQALADRQCFDHCSFDHAPQFRSPAPIPDEKALRDWSAGKTLVIGRRLPPDAAVLRGDELVGEILLTFDRLIPAYACAVESNPLPWLRRRGDRPPTFTDRDFQAATHLDSDWLGRAKTLLELKRQLILQGVPGTGKTHVARSLARLLTRGRDDTVRLVQFHPAYSYEEFVEGIKARTVEVNGRHDVTYPVEDGLLCEFAAAAARRPSEPHVLLIDEINRGNLPRIFGELLYLLEYRDQTVGLPYSRRGFRLPPNLYLIGTMNAADRSVALIDQALKRRFSFLDMPPDPAVLAAWLRDHPPAGGEAFAQTVVALFEGVNLRLRNELGPQQQIGHSYFMVPDLDADRLRVVWEHHVWPLLSEYFATTPERLADYNLDRLLHGKKRRDRAAEAESRS